MGTPQVLEPQGFTKSAEAPSPHLLCKDHTSLFFQMVYHWTMVYLQCVCFFRDVGRKHDITSHLRRSAITMPHCLPAWSAIGCCLHTLPEPPRKSTTMVAMCDTWSHDMAWMGDGGWPSPGICSQNGLMTKSPTDWGYTPTFDCRDWLWSPKIPLKFLSEIDHQTPKFIGSSSTFEKWTIHCQLLGIWDVYIWWFVGAHHILMITRNQTCQWKIPQFVDDFPAKKNIGDVQMPSLTTGG